MVNYFEWFGITEKIEVDASSLHKKYINKSKKLHPDQHVNSSYDKQEKMMLKTSINNEAYNTLKHKESRIRHMLELKNINVSGSGQSLPQEWLMEMMMLNEELEASNSGEISKILHEKECELESAIKPLYERELEDYSDEDIELLKNYYLKQKYLRRLEARLSEKS